MNPKTTSARPMNVEDEEAADPLGQKALSPREKEALLWVFHGKTNAEIAVILDVSVTTVRTYIDRAEEKLDATNRIMAASIAVRLKLIDL